MRFNLNLSDAARMNERRPVAAPAAKVEDHIAREWVGVGKPESAAERVRRMLAQ